MKEKTTLESNLGSIDVDIQSSSVEAARLSVLSFINQRSERQTCIA